MLSAIAIMIGIVLLLIGTAIGVGIFLPMIRHYLKKLPHIKRGLIALAGGAPSLVLWILFIRSKVEFTEGGGPNNWGPFFNAVILGSLLPGIILAGAGLALLLARPFLSSNQEDLER